MITVDLDYPVTPQKLLRAYFLACRRHGVENVKAYVSPSGFGVKLKINVECRDAAENLKERALLWDDPYRLRYSLKRWALGGGDTVDICFDEKDGRKMGEEITDKLRSILSRLGDDPSIDELDTAAEGLRDMINEKLKKRVYGCILFNEDHVKERMEKICGDIAAKDPTFKWYIHLSLHPEWRWKLVVEAEDRDKAWRRLTWLKNKTELRSVKTMMWVKEV
jgi:hypothetical protein